MSNDRKSDAYTIRSLGALQLPTLWDALIGSSLTVFVLKFTTSTRLPRLRSSQRERGIAYLGSTPLPQFHSNNLSSSAFLMGQSYSLVRL